MGFLCNFCSKSFSSISSLNNHKNKANYCLKIQADLNRDKENDKNRQYQDQIKKLEFELLTAHKEIEIYKMELLKKDELITKLSLEKSIVNNNNTISNSNNTSTSSSSNSSKNFTIMNSLDLSDEKLRLATDKYTIDHYNRTSEGMVQWCVDNLLKDENDKLTYICNDKNRRNFIYKSTSGEMISDPNANKLKSIIKPALTDKLKTHKKINYNMMADVSDDENEKADECINIHEQNKQMGVEFEKELVRKTYSK